MSKQPQPPFAAGIGLRTAEIHHAFFLMASRIADAAKYGAKHAATETGVPQPGQPAPSYANILKAGFEVAYVRPNWAETA
jgi:hypothetical protein